MSIYKVTGKGVVRVEIEVQAENEKEARRKAECEFEGIRTFEVERDRVRKQLVGVSGNSKIFPDGEWVDWEYIEQVH